MSIYDINVNEIKVVMGKGTISSKERGGARHTLRYILGDLGDIKEKYFILGFHLNVFSENEYYKDFGYDSMKDFCVANIPIEYSSLSRCMTVHTHTCERVEGAPWNKTNRMKEKYKEYGYSQLVELSSMDEEEEKLCLPDMSVKQIRELKKQIKEVKKDNPYHFTADKFKDAIIKIKKDDNCDVAITENEKDSTEETITELSESEKQEENNPSFNHPSFFKTFVNRPSDVVLSMFKRHFGEGLKAEPRGKMLEIEIPGYKVTIRISFKELEETEE
ncbi:MAG: hypothetical protein K1W00_06970 [Lachnospiraceae bacterium]